MGVRVNVMATLRFRVRVRIRIRVKMWVSEGFSVRMKVEKGPDLHQNEGEGHSQG